MSFKKYAKHTNHYRRADFDYFFERYPLLPGATFQVTEKLHGCNVSALFTPNEPMKVASRSHVLGDGDDLYGLKHHVKTDSRYEDLFARIQKLADTEGVEYQLYGEFFGDGIMRMKYGAKQIRFFDIRRGDTYLPKKIKTNVPFLSQSAINSFDAIVPDVLQVPKLATGLTFDEAMEFDIARQTMIGTGLIEGIVISPEFMGWDVGVSRFTVKKKNESFEERKPRKAKKEVPAELVAIRVLFMEYVNENRVESVLSKEELTSPKDFGRFIKLVVADAKDDFLAENDIRELDKLEEKYVYNAGSVIVPILKRNLQ